MNTDQKFALISYRANYYDGGRDENVSSECFFDDNLSLEALEKRIFSLARTADSGWGVPSWEFLVFADGIPIASRGENFFNKERPTPELMPLAQKIEEIFEAAHIASENEKAAIREEQARREREEMRQSQERREREDYKRALRTIELLKGKYGTKEGGQS